MTKRNPSKARPDKDVWDTPPAAVGYLAPHLDFVTAAEPMAGCGMLADALDSLGCRVVLKGDIRPRREDVHKFDALAISPADVVLADCIVTNPPWSRDSRPALHRLIDRFRALRPTWLLLPGDWAFNQEAGPYLRYCHRIVAVGRVSFMHNGRGGFDNAAWCLFGRDPVRTEFVGRIKG